MILGNILGMESFWNNFIKPVLPKKHYILGAIAGAVGGKLLGGGLMKGLLGKLGGGLMSKLGGAGLKGMMGKMGTGQGFLSTIGQGGSGFLGKVKGLKGQLSQFQPPSAGVPMGGAGSSTEEQAQVGTDVVNIAPVQLSQVSPGGSYMPPGNQSTGGQWGANIPQSGMRGIQNMQGLLGRYYGGGGYRR